jgi:hypothetical protein
VEPEEQPFGFQNHAQGLQVPAPWRAEPADGKSSEVVPSSPGGGAPAAMPGTESSAGEVALTVTIAVQAGGNGVAASVVGGSGVHGDGGLLSVFAPAAPPPRIPAVVVGGDAVVSCSPAGSSVGGGDTARASAKASASGVQSGGGGGACTESAGAAQTPTRSEPISDTGTDVQTMGAVGAGIGAATPASA